MRRTKRRIKLDSEFDFGLGIDKGLCVSKERYGKLHQKLRDLELELEVY